MLWNHAWFNLALLNPRRDLQVTLHITLVVDGRLILANPVSIHNGIRDSWRSTFTWYKLTGPLKSLCMLSFTFLVCNCSIIIMSNFTGRISLWMSMMASTSLDRYITLYTPITQVKFSTFFPSETTSNWKITAEYRSVPFLGIFKYSILSQYWNLIFNYLKGKVIPRLVRSYLTI